MQPKETGLLALRGLVGVYRHGTPQDWVTPRHRRIQINTTNATRTVMSWSSALAPQD